MERIGKKDVKGDGVRLGKNEGGGGRGEARQGRGGGKEGARVGNEEVGGE